MNGKRDIDPVLSKFLDQLLQLYDLTAHIDAKTQQLEDDLKSTIEEVKLLATWIQENKIKLGTITAVQDEIKSRRDKKFNVILSIVVLILSTICSYLLYLLGAR